MAIHVYSNNSVSVARVRGANSEFVFNVYHPTAQRVLKTFPSEGAALAYAEGLWAEHIAREARKAERDSDYDPGM